jgi:uncharacterized protein YndB with AHSA1/START domain
MNLSNAIGAEFRQVRDDTRDGEEVRVVVGVRTYDAGADDVWDALTNPERIPRWFSPVIGDLRPGGKYQIEGNAGGTITRCEPPQALDLTWEMGEGLSWVSLRLEEDKAATRLTLEHTMRKDEASEAHWAKYGPGATGVGWDLSFLGLALYFEVGGEPLDKEAIFAWMGAAEGKAFIRACAEAWGKAHIAAGEAAEVADAMAKATGDFYTGE